MPTTMSKQENNLLQLIRFALDSSMQKADLNLKEPDWNQLLQMAALQGVQGILFDAVQKFGQDSEAPSLNTLADYVLASKDIRTKQDDHKQGIRKMTAYLTKQGIHTILIKGLTLSPLYPNPLARPTGDIDIYMFADEKTDKPVAEIGDDLFRQLGLDVNFTGKHSAFVVAGVDIENHYTFFHDYLSDSNFRAEQMMMDCITDKATGLVDKSCLGYLEELGVYTLPANANHLFLMCHMSQHFSIYESIALRHLLDWGYFLNSIKNDSSFDWEKAKERIVNLKYDRINDIYTCLAEDLTGIDLSMFCIDKERNVGKRDKQLFLEDILAEKEEMPTEFISQWRFRLRNFINQRWKHKYLPDSYWQRIWHKTQE